MKKAVFWCQSLPDDLRWVADLLDVDLSNVQENALIPRLPQTVQSLAALYQKLAQDLNQTASARLTDAALPAQGRLLRMAGEADPHSSHFSKVAVQEIMTLRGTGSHPVEKCIHFPWSPTTFQLLLHQVIHNPLMPNSETGRSLQGQLADAFGDIVFIQIQTGNMLEKAVASTLPLHTLSPVIATLETADQYYTDYETIRDRYHKLVREDQFWVDFFRTTRQPPHLIIPLDALYMELNALTTQTLGSVLRKQRKCPLYRKTRERLLALIGQHRGLNEPALSGRPVRWLHSTNLVEHRQEVFLQEAEARQDHPEANALAHYQQNNPMVLLLSGKTPCEPPASHWAEVPGRFNGEAIYQQMVALAQDEDVFVEVGGFLGRSTAFMAQHIKKSAKKIDFYTVDLWEKPAATDNIAGVLEKFSQDMFAAFTYYINGCGVADKVCPIVMPSVEAAKLFNDKSLDFVFIDGDPHYEEVQATIRMWYPKLKPGGVMAGAHYLMPSVQHAVDEFFLGHPALTLYDREWPCWIIDPNHAFKGQPRMYAPDIPKPAGRQKAGPKKTGQGVSLSGL